MSIPQEYTVKPLAFDDRSLKLYSRFLTDWYKLPDLFTFEYIKWQYADNPVGKAVGYNAFFKDELIAHVCTIPLRAEMFGSEEKWLLLVNAMTVPAHRRKGISVGMAEKVEQLGIDLGCTFIIGIANRNSTPSYIKGRAMELSCTLEARIGIGMPKREKRLDENYHMRVLWDKQSLAWRLTRPGSRYWKQTNQEGCRIFASSGKPGIKTFLGNCATEDVGAALPGKGKAVMPFNLWVGKDPNIRWGRSLFVPIPERLRPSPLNFLFKDLSGKKRSLVDKRIFFQAIDFDAF